VDQNSLIRALTFILGVVLLLAVSWGAFKAVTEAKADYKVVDAIETLDTDIALAQTIDSLEAKWNHRLNYHFSVKQDPLFLGRVIVGFSYSRMGYREFDEGIGFRLSATVIDNNPKAIIKFKGKSHVLQVGDTLEGGYVIKEIMKKKVVLNRNGELTVLSTKPVAQMFDQYIDQSYDYR